MSMLFNFRPLVINPELATRIGLNEAIVLQQVNYWINDKEQGVIHSGRRWVFNSYESWVKQFPFWSADTVKRAFTSLVKQGCLDVEQLNKSQHDRTNYYTINHDCELLNDAEQVPSSNGASCPDRQVQDAPMDEGKNARSLMVITTKTTTEIKNTLGASAAPLHRRPFPKVVNHLGKPVVRNQQRDRNTLQSSKPPGKHTQNALVAIQKQRPTNTGRLASPTAQRHQSCWRACSATRPTSARRASLVLNTSNRRQRSLGPIGISKKPGKLHPLPEVGVAVRFRYLASVNRITANQTATGDKGKHNVEHQTTRRKGFSAGET